MPLCAFTKLFPKRVSHNGKPTGLHPSKTFLTAYNGTDIPQLGALDSSITWKGTSQMRSMKTTWYVADTPGPVILGLPSYSQLEIVHLNCSTEFLTSTVKSRAIELGIKRQPRYLPFRHSRAGIKLVRQIASIASNRESHISASNQTRVCDGNLLRITSNHLQKLFIIDSGYHISTLDQNLRRQVTSKLKSWTKTLTYVH